MQSITWSQRRMDVCCMCSSYSPSLLSIHQELAFSLTPCEWLRSPSFVHMDVNRRCWGELAGDGAESCLGDASFSSSSAFLVMVKYSWTNHVGCCRSMGKDEQVLKVRHDQGWRLPASFLVFEAWEARVGWPNEWRPVTERMSTCEGLPSKPSIQDYK